jgi:hypothetical protein
MEAHMGSSLSYFMRRGAQERAAANKARGKARKAHEQLADRYHELVRSADELDRLSEEPHG